MAEQDVSQNGNTNLNQQLVPTESSKQVAEKKVGEFNFEEIGATGTKLYGEVYDEEYLSKLTGTRRADIFDEMLRSDDVITMLLSARKNPILKANWSVEPAKADDGDTAQEALYKRMAEHAEHEFFHRMNKDFLEFVDEALTFIEHGYSLFERIHEKVDDQKFGQYVGFKNIAWRSQRTIEYWKLDRSGKIESVFQQADGDVGAHAQLPGQWVTVFSLRKRGDNYEGISALRPIYGNWQRKTLFLKLIAIGLERYAINTPVGTIPAGKEESPERTKFINMLKSISSHQQNFFALPEGWLVDFLKNPFDADKVVSVIAREDEGMVKSFVANHLTLGSGGNGGAYALGTDFSDQFLSIIENDAAIVTRRFNKEIMREFINFNYGVQTKYPTLKVTGINDKFSKEFADIVVAMADKKMLTATENLERYFRKRLDLPELLQADAELIPDVRKTEAPKLFSENACEHEHDTRATFADLRKTKAKIEEQLDQSALLVAQAMQENLKVRAEEFAARLIKDMKSVTPEQWRKVIRNQDEFKKPNEYNKKLQKVLAEVAGRAIAQARNEVPGGRKAKFCDGLKSRLTLAEIDDVFAGLPKALVELIVTYSQLVAEDQFTDIRSSILFAANSGVAETADIALITKQVQDAIDLKIVGAGESGIAASIQSSSTIMSTQTYNTARDEFFQSPDVVGSIVAYQFQNTDPKTPICKDLVSRVFDRKDPKNKPFLPPLHYNCKSYIVPIMESQGLELHPDGLLPSSPSLLKYKNL